MTYRNYTLYIGRSSFRPGETYYDVRDERNTTVAEGWLIGTGNAVRDQALRDAKRAVDKLCAAEAEIEEMRLEHAFGAGWLDS
jgi:hypothetical protein